VKMPPMWSGSAGVIVTLHSPAVEENSTDPSGPATVNDKARSAVVSVRLKNDEPNRRSCCPEVPCHVMSIGAGGGAQTAGVATLVMRTSRVRSPDTLNVAVPVVNPLSGPGEPVALGEGLAEGELSCGGGEPLGP
jgi:hypothetical protein